MKPILIVCAEAAKALMASAAADENTATRRLEPHAIAFSARQERGEARPASCRLDRVVGDDEDFVQPQWVDLGCVPELLRREVLDVLDAALGHLLRRQPHHL